MLPYFNPVKASISQQLIVLSNTVPVDKKAISALKSTLATIDKPGVSSLPNDLKLLSTVSAALGKTSRAAALQPSVDGAVDQYLSLLYGMARQSSNSLAAAYASPSKIAAQKSLDALFATLDSANATTSAVAAAKLLNKGISQWTATDKLVTRAGSVPPPAAGVTAKITGAESWDFKSTQAVAVDRSPGNVLVNSTQAILKSPFGQRTITFSMYGLKEGANTLTVHNNDAFVTEIFGNQTGAGFESQSGTIQANYNPTAKTIAGSFTFVLFNQDDHTKLITATGTFSATIK